MAIYSVMCAVVDNPLSDIPITETPVISDGTTQAVQSASDFVEKFINMDFFNDVLIRYTEVFAIGFAFATLLILLTFGVFKAFSLVRID